MNTWQQLEMKTKRGNQLLFFFPKTFVRQLLFDSCLSYYELVWFLERFSSLLFKFHGQKDENYMFYIFLWLFRIDNILCYSRYFSFCFKVMLVVHQHRFDMAYISFLTWWMMIDDFADFCDEVFTGYLGSKLLDGWIPGTSAREGLLGAILWITAELAGMSGFWQDICK